MQRIRELAVQSINDTNSSSDRQALNNEVQQLIAEVNRIASSTQFNGQNILDGSLPTLTFQVGANQNQTILVDGVDARGSQLGAEVFSGASITQSGISAVSGLTINGQAVDLTGVTDTNGVIDAINQVAADSGVQAQSVSTTSQDLTYATDAVNARSITVNGVQIDIAANTAAADVDELINAVSGQTGVTASEAGGTITLTSSLGADIELTEDAANAVFSDGPGAGASETYEAGLLLTTEVGATITVAGTNVANLGLTAGNLATTSSILNDVNVLTGTDANDALLTLDFALQQVSGLRAELGAVQTRFESTISNLEVTTENQSAARSRIRDADFAAETAELTRNQILQQAGISVLSQANALPQNVLALLQ
jgi:flagellin